MLSNENKNFCGATNEIQHFYFLTRGLIASTHAFNFLTRAFNFPTHAFCILTRGFKLVTRGFEFVTRGLDFVTCNS